MTDRTRALVIDDANATTITNSTLGVIRFQPAVSTDHVSVINSTFASVSCQPRRGTITNLSGPAVSGQ